MTLDESKNLIREVVEQKILDLLSDPDAGLELREEFKAELQQSLEAIQAGGTTVTAQEVANRLGLDW